MKVVVADDQTAVREGLVTLLGTMPGVQVVGAAGDESVLGALRAGAFGYLTKDAGRDHIGRALEAAANGQAILDSTVHAQLVEAAKDPPRTSGPLPDGLTDREAEVLALIASGRSNTEIASELYVSEATVKTHVDHIFTKTGSRDRSQAVAYAHRHGLAG
jgi:DNA-binding NarL/FixJ family response regulator